MKKKNLINDIYSHWYETNNTLINIKGDLCDVSQLFMLFDTAIELYVSNYIIL